MKDSDRANNIRAALSGDGEDKPSLVKSLGGVQGMLEALVPALLFIVVQTVVQNLWISAAVTVVSILAFAVIRGVQKGSFIHVSAGAFGALIGIVFALGSNKATNAYVPGFIVNAVWSAAFGISLLFARPLTGLLLGVLMPEVDWRGNRKTFRAHLWVSGAWLAMFVLRLAIQVPIWLASQQSGDIVLLGSVRLVMGLPLTGAVLVLSYVLLAPHYRALSEESDEESSEASDVSDPKD